MSRAGKSGILSSRRLELLASLLQEQGHRVEDTSLPLTRSKTRDEFPLSFAQQRMWVLEQIEPGNHYNDPFPLRFDGSLDPEILERCLNEIVRRHDALRASFDTVGGIPLQRIAPEGHIDVPRIDLRHLPADRRELEAKRLTVHDSRKRFDIRTGPVLRATLIRVADEQHILTLTFHHIALDGWSRGVFLRELATIYEALAQGRESPLEDLAVQYGDFALWQRALPEGTRLEPQLAYWKRQLTGAVPTEIAPDRPRPPVQKHNGARHWFSIGRPTLEAIKRLCIQEGCTAFMVLVTAFQALIGRYTAVDDVVIGSPVAGRTRPELEPLIGYFLNILVLRTDLSGNPTFRDLLKRVKETTLGALAHQELPFERLVDVLHPHRDTSRSALFQVMFILQNTPGLTHCSAELNVAPFEIDNGTAKFDLTVSVRETLQGFEGWAEYDTALYEHGTIENLLSYYVKLVESGVNAPDRRIGDLTVVSDEERSTLLVDWNRTAADYPRQQCVDHLVSDQCCLTPDKVAVECKGERLTYAQLNDRADRLATLLRAERVERGDLVGICVERSVGMLAAILGTLKSGAAYLPLDPAFPRGRLATMIEESRTRVILTQRDLLSVLPEGEPRKICLDELAPSVMTSSPLPLQAERNSRDLAYVLFTSGSTGRPKGVEISHQALVNLLWAMRRQPGLQAGDVLLAVTTLSFDIAGLELFLPLLVGAKVVIAPREITADGPRLAKLISESGATVMQATPTTWRMLIESGWHGDPRLKLLSGGEPLRADLAERLLQRCGELWNMYGPTETTVWSTTERVMAEQKITLGRPIANTQLYVLDEGRNPVPPGAAGELYIGGEGLARGYLNRPDLTNERFVPNPFDTSGVGRLYRTGDLVRYGPDGRAEFLGRTDQQVKVRGFRIELGEIEAALESTAGIGQAVVVVAPDAMGLNRLVAYVVPAGGSSDIRHNELVTTLRATLPESMVPSAFVVVEAIPLTPNGKVDRKALPPPQENAGIAEYEAPQGEVEEKLADIIGRLLKVRQVGRTDSFFDLGGHSLLAVMLFAEIAQTFGMNLPLVTLFRAPSVQELARVLAEKRTRRPWASLVPIQPRGDRRKLFCVHGAGGNVLLYRDLARYFEQDRPFYGLQSQGLDRNAPCITTIEAMAEKYLQEVRALQPEGPYHLGGYCLGGTVAYEMAQQLRADGQQVALLALFDTYNFSRMTEPGSLSFILQKAHFHVSNLGHMGVNHWTGYLANKLRVARDGEWSALSKTALRAFGRSQRGRSRELSVSEVNDIAASAYRPQPYWGPVTLFKPRVNYDFLPDPRMGWGDLVRHLEIVELNVNPHAMLVEPYVRLLANELRRRMDAFDSPRRSPDHPALLA